MKAAVLILGFNRPDKLRKALNTAKQQAKERRIYIAIDGPRMNNKQDVERVEECRIQADEFKQLMVGVHLRFSPDNLGCKRGVINAINWFFDHEECGIVLEDDCIPSDDFFPYCDDLLERYRGEKQVWLIAGDNSSGLKLEHSFSYSFSPEPLIWGWATWRDRWQRYDAEMEGWKRIRSTEVAKEIFRDEEQFLTRQEVFDRVADGQIDTWDYQLSATIRIDRGLCIVPRVNLISNIGFGSDATHTKNAMDPRNERPPGRILPLKHPPCIFLDKNLEAQIIEKIQGVRYAKNWRKAARRARSIYKTILRRVQ